MSGVRVTGDFKELAGFVARLEAMPKAAPRAAAMAAVAIDPIIAGTVAARTDAYGRPWAPRVDGGPVRVSGKLAKMTSRAGSVIATVSRRVPRFLNRGRVGSGGRARGGDMVARPIIPEGEIPETWLRALDEASTKALGPDVALVTPSEVRGAAKAAAKAVRAAKRATMAAAREKRAVERSDKAIAKFKADVAKASKKFGGG